MMASPHVGTIPPVVDREPADHPLDTSPPYNTEPQYCEPAKLWLYGNSRLLGGHLAYVARACGPIIHDPRELEAIERDAEEQVLNGKVLVCGIHNPAHQRAALLPLRWGAPRIVVFSGGFHYHLGEDLKEEPFRTARLWRYQWDPKTDLAVSRRAPDKKPTYAHQNPTVDRLIELLAKGQWVGLSPARPNSPES